MTTPGLTTPRPTRGPTGTPGQQRASARQRLLDAANELFYEEGVHTVGIDRVIERAGVAKASLYNAFGSKDELIRAYLAARSQAIRERMTRELASRFSTARDRLIGVFDVQGDVFDQPGYRGCAFLGASAESRPGSSVEHAAADHRGWLRSLLVELATEAGATDPHLLAQQLIMLYDGAAASAWLDHKPSAALAAQAVAAVLVDTAIAR
jgi:AcrR family transcriptional regulator